MPFTTQFQIAEKTTDQETTDKLIATGSSNMYRQNMGHAYLYLFVGTGLMVGSALRQRNRYGPVRLRLSEDLSEVQARHALLSVSENPLSLSRAIPYNTVLYYLKNLLFMLYDVILCSITISRGARPTKIGSAVLAVERGLQSKFRYCSMV